LKDAPELVFGAIIPALGKSSRYRVDPFGFREAIERVKGEVPNLVPDYLNECLLCPLGIGERFLGTPRR
jgi:hypothetical protein